MFDNRYESGNVEFNNERSVLYSRFTPSNKVPSVVKFFMGLGYTQEQATRTVLACAAVMFLVAFFIFFFHVWGGGPERLSKEAARKQIEDYKKVHQF